jgi:nucleotide sugar dehydrogenase
MSSSILHIKPEEIDTTEKRGKYTVGIIGCGRIGILHAFLYAEAGFRTRCTDADQTVVNSIARGKFTYLSREIGQKMKSFLKTKTLSASTDAKTTVSQSDLIIVAVPVKIDQKKKANYSELENACKTVGSNLHSGVIVVIASTVGVGFTQNSIKETLENTSGLKVGVDFALAYSPLQHSNAQTLETLANQERIVAAEDQKSLDAASIVLGNIARNIKKTRDVKSAEASVLFNATLLDVDAALAKEFALFCEKAGLDYVEVQKVGKNTQSTSRYILFNDSIWKEPYIMLEDAENLNLKIRIPAIARQVNEEIVKHIVNLIKDALKNCGKPLKRARICMLGISETPNSQGHPKKIVSKIANMLGARGAKISVFDPYFSGIDAGEMKDHFKRSMAEALEGTDCVLIVTGHDHFKRLNLKKFKVVMRMPAAIVDLEGIFEPKKVEEEGFIFRGLGRGVWTK